MYGENVAEKVTKKECAEIMKGVLKARGLWNDADLSKAVHLDMAVIRHLKNEGASPATIKKHNLGVLNSGGTAGILIPSAIEEAINEVGQQRPSPRLPGRSGDGEIGM